MGKMLRKAAHLILCVFLIALQPAFKCERVLELTSASDITVSSHDRGLKQLSGCATPKWQCSFSSEQQMRLADSAHAAVLAGNCTQVSTAMSLWQCGQNLVQGDLITAVQQGGCFLECIDSAHQLCTVPPSPAPAPSESFTQ